MADYLVKFEDTAPQDGLFAGGEIPVRIENVSVKGGSEFERGCILAGASGIFEPAKAKSDGEKVLVVAAEDFSSSSTGVASVYTSGNFHTSKLSTGSSVVSAADFKEELRQVDIIETELREI